MLLLRPKGIQDSICRCPRFDCKQPDEFTDYSQVENGNRNAKFLRRIEYRHVRSNLGDLIVHVPLDVRGGFQLQHATHDVFGILHS